MYIIHTCKNEEKESVRFSLQLMDPRRASRTVSDPKVRQVGFFTPGASSPDRSQSGPPDPHPISSSPPTITDLSPSSGNSLSPVMIPPPRHVSAPLSPLLRDSAPPGTMVNSNSNNATELFTAATSPTATTSFSDSGRGGTAPSSSYPGGGGVGGLDMPQTSSSVPGSGLTTVSVFVNLPPGLDEKAGISTDVQNSNRSNLKRLKEKTTKAERRALQEAQQAAKAAAKAEGAAIPANAKLAKSAKVPSQKNDNAPTAASEKKGGEHPPEKDRKKDVPQPRMQYDDKSRVEKAKKRAVVKQTEARNRVELFRHLPQYEHGTQLPDLESKFFQLDPMHPAVYKVGLQYLSGDVCGGNARCIAMLQAFQEVINDYSTPPEKTLVRDLTAKIGSYVSFLIECRPLSISMGNAIRFLKNRIVKLPLTLSEAEAKATLHADIDCFIYEKIIVADKVIVKHAVTKIRDGDVLLTYGSSSAVEMILLHAHELGKQFQVVVVDSRPKLEGQLLLRRLLGKGISCTYTHINAVSYIMHEVTQVVLGASSVLSNGTVYSRVGTACVAMMAHAFHVPVLVCCEAYKFHERVQLDSICSNELGDPDAISKVHGRDEINFLGGCATSENMQLLNLIYDATPSEYVSMIITDYGMVPPTSVPVIVREYRREHWWI
ncbi:translation initiation factor eIF-2B subunit delta isoform X2 [Ricinus communis]|uniref:translation initiation factor eIF-2B subunit delta isoform X2 n=1 Tax=Ricinus communis TaxID=3988 RepID=UPI00201A4357|nr:translation initiation factor eIF-2B subunit delta isoform X2 [Ricinus communis]